MKSVEQIGCTAGNWIDEEELPIKANLKVVRRNDPDYGLKAVPTADRGFLLDVGRTEHEARISADGVLLATGRFLGGGLQSNHTSVAEPIFDLPVFQPKNRELWHGGGGTGNRMTRMPPMSASGIAGESTYSGWINLNKSRPMDKRDIREFRRWHVDAAKRAKAAGFDIVYIYSGMNFGPYQFLLPWVNRRTDEYGGSLENRVRLTREIAERRQAEETLRESEERFRETVELLPNAVCEYDAAGHLTYVNTYGLDLIGHSLEDLENGLQRLDRAVESLATG